MMAAENMSDWSATRATINEAVWAAKQYLDDLFDRYETLAEFVDGEVCTANDGKPLFSDSRFFQTVRNEGVGDTIIGRFLGKGWEDRAKRALDTFSAESAEAQAKRLRAREERQKAKAEAARQEANRLREEAERKAPRFILHFSAKAVDYL